MEIAIFFIIGLLTVLYLFKPVSNFEKENFRNKNNWRGGF